MRTNILFLFFCALHCQAQTPSNEVSDKTTLPAVLKQYPENPEPFELSLLAQNLGVPWGMVFINKKELLFTEREGNLKILHLPTGNISSVSGLPKVCARGQGGLLDVALHPQFQTNKIIYFSFSKKKSTRGCTTSLARAELKNRRLENIKILFSAKPLTSSQKHFGSRILVHKGFLFFTVGDRDRKQEAQNLNSHLGKLLRLTDDGQIPSDNPFVGQKEVQPEIWSYGHRNPQGLALHPETKEIWLQEHGPKGGDEINIIKKGANYGWPVITYGKSYAGFKIGEGVAKEGMLQPVRYWTPSIAPCGLLIYSGKKFPKWKGDLFSGALLLTHLNRIKIKNKKPIKEERLLADLNLRVRNVIEGPEGFIYISADRGWILKLKPLGVTSSHLKLKFRAAFFKVNFEYRKNKGAFSHFPLRKRREKRPDSF